MKRINNDKILKRELVSLIIHSSNIKILGVNIKFLDNYMNVSITLTSFVGAIVGLIGGFLFNNIRNGLIIGIITGIIFGIYIGFKINRDQIKKISVRYGRNK